MVANNSQNLANHHDNDLLQDSRKSETEITTEESTSEENIEQITEPFDPMKIRVTPKPTTLDVLIKRMRSDPPGINLSPDFQRESGIWRIREKSRLIESLLIRIPIPAFYFDATEEDCWIVIDGLQRLSTIKEFVCSGMKLLDLEFLKQFNGKTFDELPSIYQRRIEESDIVLYRIEPGTPERVKFDIFRRINTGGEPLTAQEIRHALNLGICTKFLKRLAETDAFKTATDNSFPSRRMEDRECTLRFLAFDNIDIATYKTNDLDSFLNDYMQKFNKRYKDDGLDCAELNALCVKFENAMKIASELFGNDAFRKRYNENDARKLASKALFEAWSVNLAKLSETNTSALLTKKDILKDKFVKLMNDDKEFENSVSQGTGAIRKVQKRFKAIKHIIEETISC